MMLSESPAVFWRRVVITPLAGQQGLAAGSQADLGGGGNGRAIGTCTVPARERGSRDVIQTNFSLHVSEAKHLHLPARRCCVCWLPLLSLSRLCPELTWQFSLPAFVPQAELDCLEGSSATRTEWSSGQASPPSTYPADLCVLHYVHYYSVRGLLFVVTSNTVCMSCSCIFDRSS